ncbi:MAG: hypothetical protein WC623_21870 [Pedobacter sp.]|uniref:hypothetical protein n=1 Tax=Pedobacter sp. TaxID=1411316 RepID=UPI00356B4D2C
MIHKIPQTNKAFLFLVFVSIIDWIATSVSIFSFGGSEMNPIANYFIMNYGIIGFSLLGLFYLSLMLIFSNILTGVVSIIIGSWHVLGAWTQMLNILGHMYFSNVSDMWYYSLLFTLCAATVIAYEFGKKDNVVT